MVKRPKKDFGPGLEENKKRGFKSPFFLPNYSKTK